MEITAEDKSSAAHSRSFDFSRSSRCHQPLALSMRSRSSSSREFSPWNFIAPKRETKRKRSINGGWWTIDIRFFWRSENRCQWEIKMDDRPGMEHPFPRVKVELRTVKGIWLIRVLPKVCGGSSPSHAPTLIITLQLIPPFLLYFITFFVGQSPPPLPLDGHAYAIAFSFPR